MPLRGPESLKKLRPLSVERVRRLRERFVGVPDSAVAKLPPDPGRTHVPGDRTLCATDAWEEIPIDQKWMSAARLVYQGDDLVIGELRIFPREQVAPWTWNGNEVDERFEPSAWSAELLGIVARVPHGGLSARVLRKVRLREHARVLSEKLAQWARVAGYAGHGFKVPATERPRPERRTGRSDIFYAKLAWEYVRALARDPRRPVALLAHKRKLPKERVRDMLHEARERGLLSPGHRGRSGGALTTRAMNLLSTPRKKKR